MASHTGKYKHFCSVCQKGFMQTRLYNIHLHSEGHQKECEKSQSEGNHKEYKKGKTVQSHEKECESSTQVVAANGVRSCDPLSSIQHLDSPSHDPGALSNQELGSQSHGAILKTLANRVAENGHVSANHVAFLNAIKKSPGGGKAEEQDKGPHIPQPTNAVMCRSKVTA